MGKFLAILFLSILILSCTDEKNSSKAFRHVSSASDSLIFKYLYKNNDSEIINNAYKENPFVIFEKEDNRNGISLMRYKLGYRTGDSEIIIRRILLDTIGNRIFEMKTLDDQTPTEWQHNKR